MMKESKRRMESLGVTVSSREKGFPAFVKGLSIRPDIFVTPSVGTTAVWRRHPGFSGTGSFRKLMGYLGGLKEEQYNWELLDGDGGTIASGGGYQKGWTTRVRYVDENGTVGLFWGSSAGGAA